MNSNRKGKDGERELAAKLREYGLTAKRGQQHKGGPDSADVEVEEWPDIHIECKRTEKFQLYPAMRQAICDSFGEYEATTQMPMVAHRRNGEEWVVVLLLDDFVYRILDSGSISDRDYRLSRIRYWQKRATAAELTLAENGLETRI